MTEQSGMHQLINLARFALDQVGSDEYLRMLAETRDDLERDGCAVLKGFVHPSALSRLAEEADRVASAAHRSFNRTNVYFTKDDPSLPSDHPARQFFDRSNAFVPADNFGANSLLRSIYEWPEFGDFIQEALCEKHFHHYADPLADVIINVVEEGGGFPWHFDTNNYTVTLAIQNGESGGEFCYAPWMRSPVDENIDGVADVLAGRSDAVQTLVLEPGDLQIFKGRYALHRVAPVTGSRPRYVGIFSFVEEPEMVASPERCKQLYGRVLPVHYERAGHRFDELMD